MCIVSVASASTTLVGGGATLPAIGYTGSATGAPIGSTSLFGVYTNNLGGKPVSYCLTGSGAGKKILAGNVLGNTVNDACPSGFGGSGLTQPHFSGSDAPLSVSEYNAYVSGHGAGAQPTQLPAIAGAIGIVFKKTGVNALTLTEAQICGIFSGQITDWSQITISSAGPINVVYRSESSGTSFSFLNHLSAVCPGTASPLPPTKFKTFQSFAMGAGLYIPSYASSLPAGGANGNAGVVAAVAGVLPGSVVDGSVGYAEVANGVIGGVRIASVTNMSGVTVNPATAFGPTALPLALTFDKAIADDVTDGTVLGELAGRPKLVDLPASSNGCIAMVAPDSYANPSSGYPIIAVTNLLGNAQGNGSDASAVRILLGTPYNTSIRSLVRTIGRIGTGYAWLSNAGLTQSRVDSCIN